MNTIFEHIDARRNLVAEVAEQFDSVRYFLVSFLQARDDDNAVHAEVCELVARAQFARSVAALADLHARAHAGKLSEIEVQGYTARREDFNADAARLMAVFAADDDPKQ